MFKGVTNFILFTFEEYFCTLSSFGLLCSQRFLNWVDCFEHSVFFVTFETILPKNYYFLIWVYLRHFQKHVPALVGTTLVYCISTGYWWTCRTRGSWGSGRCRPRATSTTSTTPHSWSSGSGIFSLSVSQSVMSYL